MKRSIQKFVRVDDTDGVSVDIYGDPDAPSIVVVPGVMSDAQSWRNVAESLTAWPSVAVVNRRGRYPSTPLSDDYGLHTEMADLHRVLDAIGDPATLFGWSYGGLIALLVARERSMEHLVAYEPVAPGFGSHALPALRRAAADADWGRVVEIINRDVSGFSHGYVEGLRADHATWTELMRLSKPLHAELEALSRITIDGLIGAQANTIDLIIGANNVGVPPYGSTFEKIAAHLRGSSVHHLADQGHLAHIEAPTALARLIDELAPPRVCP
ncbi:alpha/beta fold hydrolase [Tsukamurella sp. 1534]|uniref:alpha/beta fold hydrolase n=1 Tax=Tsukamurella sp. 1534 TaxID=1151061 RepID=UPI000594173E|nr:alpha/beta hydrolase [Tsukamurella sp. 1534]